MKKTALMAVLFQCATALSINSTAVHAIAPSKAVFEQSPAVFTAFTPTGEPAVLAVNTPSAERPAQDEKPDEQSEPEAEPSARPAQPEKPKEPTRYTIQPGDSLTKIAESHQTTIERLYAKNTQIEHPDMLAIGDSVTIPLPDEKLPERPLPAPVQPEPVAAPAPQAQPSYNPEPVAARTTPVYTTFSSAGNTYSAGYCTWYAKSRRPDLPNNLGNADTWAARAAAQGIPTGYEPRVGAIGQQGMHVVYVESVNADGTVTVSEMNFVGWGVVSSRTVPASSFVYIY